MASLVVNYTSALPLPRQNNAANLYHCLRMSHLSSTISASGRAEQCPSFSPSLSSGTLAVSNAANLYYCLRISHPGWRRCRGSQGRWGYTSAISNGPGGLGSTEGQDDSSTIDSQSVANENTESDANSSKLPSKKPIPSQKTSSTSKSLSAFGRASEYLRKKRLGAFDKDAPTLDSTTPQPEPPPGPLPKVEIIRGNINGGSMRTSALEFRQRIDDSADASIESNISEGTDSAATKLGDGGSGSQPLPSARPPQQQRQETATMVAERASSSSLAAGGGNGKSGNEQLEVRGKEELAVATLQKEVSASLQGAGRENGEELLSASEGGATYGEEEGAEERVTGSAAASEQSYGGGGEGGGGSNNGQEAPSSSGVVVPLAFAGTEGWQESASAELLAARTELQEAAAAAATQSLDKGTASSKKESEKYSEVEIVTREGVTKRRVLISEQAAMLDRSRGDVRKSGVSPIDFAGLDFGDRRQAAGGAGALPAGLRENFDAVPLGALPEVEILTRDANKGSTGLDPADPQEKGNAELYKPKVSTWGVFPRPDNISQAYGGGRNIAPGQSLETPEEKERREANTQRLLQEFRRKAGLNISAETKARCDKAIQEGKALMDVGDLVEALPLFDGVMAETVFNSELHGLAALQRALCLDSMARSEEARSLYEKLCKHPNGGIRKRATQMLFGFQAAKKLKLEGSATLDTSIYQRYFSAFSDGYNTMYKASTEENNGLTGQALAYFVLLLSPILLLLAFVYMGRT